MPFVDVSISIRFDSTNVPDNTKDYILEISRIFLDVIQTESGRLCNIEAPPEILIRFYIRSTYTNLTWTTDESYSVDISTESE